MTIPNKFYHQIYPSDLPVRQFTDKFTYTFYSLKFEPLFAVRFLYTYRVSHNYLDWAGLNIKIGIAQKVYE